MSGSPTLQTKIHFEINPTVTEATELHGGSRMRHVAGIVRVETQ